MTTDTQNYVSVIEEGQVGLVQRLLEGVVFFSSNSNLRSENMELLISYHMTITPLFTNLSSTTSST